MKYLSINHLLPLSILSMILLSACGPATKNAGPFSNALGSYDGFVVHSEPKNDVTIQTAVTALVSIPANNEIAIHISSTETESIWDFSIHLDRNKLILSSMPDLLDGAPQTLRQSKNSKFCYETISNPNNEKKNARLCYDGNEISIGYTNNDISNYIFALDKRTEENQPKLETPKSYSVSELIDRGINQSFSSQLQFQTALRSRLDAEVAYWKLSPSISFQSITGILSFQLSNLFNVVGDIAPFIIPENWIIADSSNWQSNADYCSWLLMKANSGNIAEGMAYAILRDKANLAAITNYEAPLKEMQDAILQKELLGFLPVGTSQQAAAYYESLQETKLQLEQLIKTESRDLAAAVGFVNPDAIADISLDITQSPDSPIDFPTNNIPNLVVGRSLELKQLDSLMHIATNKVNSRTYSWASSYKINPGILSEIASAQTSIAEIGIQRKQLQSILLLKTENAIDDVKNTLRNYAKAKKALEDFTAQHNSLSERASLGLAIVSNNDLQTTIQNQMKIDSDLNNAKFSYFIAVGKLNRLMMIGPYLDISTRASVNFDDRR